MFKAFYSTSILHHVYYWLSEIQLKDDNNVILSTTEIMLYQL
jgi:hypothetical protein